MKRGKEAATRTSEVARRLVDSFAFERGGHCESGCVRIKTLRSFDGLKFFLRTSNSVALIFFTPSAQKLTRFDGSPLSTTSRNSTIGPAQLPPVVRM